MKIFQRELRLTGKTVTNGVQWKYTQEQICSLLQNSLHVLSYLSQLRKDMRTSLWMVQRKHLTNCSCIKKKKKGREIARVLMGWDVDC